jgi:hypothetical protein
MTYAAGYSCAAQNAPGDVFGISWKGLPGATLADVVARNHGILHSFKSHGPFIEEESRAHFRKIREADSAKVTELKS